MAAASARAGREAEIRRRQEEQRRGAADGISIEQALDGRVVPTRHGAHFETVRCWQRHQRHGGVEIGELAGLPHDLLTALLEERALASPPERWAFLDTETTGLAGGTGTSAFLVGVGRITRQGFHVTQFFMRDHGDEPSMLQAVSDALGDADTLITYNGKAFDVPLLETRYRLSRAKPPFSRMAHLDLLYGARRLWRLRLESCRLVELEARILGFEREGDIAGDLIPLLYFEYLRSKEAWRLAPVFLHNALDIVTLACLTAIVAWAFRAPDEVPLAHGTEMVGLARWLRKEDKPEEALALMRRGVDKGLPEPLLWRCLWDIAVLEKKLRREDAARAVFSELASCPNEFQAGALEELAKYYEHREKNYSMALEMTESALAIRATPELQRRRERLLGRAASPRNGRLL
jgi:uncharacterized protein YprB with RNaseH-like and TPR domain